MSVLLALRELRDERRKMQRLRRDLQERSAPYLTCFGMWQLSTWESEVLDPLTRALAREMITMDEAAEYLLDYCADPKNLHVGT